MSHDCIIQLLDDQENVATEELGWDIQYAKNIEGQQTGLRVGNEIVIVDKYLRLGMLWAMLYGSMRASVYATFQQSVNKRLAAISNIVGLQAPVTMAITEVEHRAMQHCRRALLPNVAKLVHALFNAERDPDTRFEKVRKYVRDMMCGQDMGGFMAIHEFLLQSHKTRAHANNTVLGEAIQYFEMYRAVQDYCAERGVPKEAYTLIDSSASLIDASRIRTLRFCTIYFKRKYEPSWAGYADVSNTRGVETAYMAALVDTKLNVRSSGDHFSRKF